MQLQTKDYGVIDYEEKDLFHFSDGLFGFSQVQHYLPLCLTLPFFSYMAWRIRILPS